MKTKIRGVVSMTTWADEDCGCSSSDDGWWIVSLSCEEHLYMVPVTERKQASSYGHSVQYGPFVPRRIRVLHRTVMDQEIASENHAISSLQRRRP